MTDLFPMKVYSHFTVKIPTKVARKHNIHDGDTVIFIDDDKGIRIALKEEYLKGVTK